MEEPIEDKVAIERALRLLTTPGQVFEIRALSGQKWKGMQGFFDDPALAAAYVERLSEEYKGVYFTLNPVTDDLIYRSHNKLRKQEEGVGATDGEISRRRWLPVDIDPKRTKGISSTPSEHAGALKLAQSIANTLELTYGFPEPVFASSGNGAHLLYAIDEANDDATRDQIKAFLVALEYAFGTAALEIDPVNFNASRIWRLYGTVARKGDHTLERPHRLSKIISEPDFRECVSMADLAAFCRANGGVKVGPAAPKGQGLYDRSYPADEGRWRLLNRAALDRVDEWVPAAFGNNARPYNKGYRVSSDRLGRNKEEDLTIHAWPRGIKDFGEHDSGESSEGRRTPVTLIAEWVMDGDKASAAKWLSDCLKVDASEFEKIAAKVSSEDESDEYEATFASTAPIAKKFNYGAIKTANGVMTQKFRDLNWLIDEMLPEGAYFLSSRPKMRKSWLALQLAIATATGGEIFGRKVNKGKVLGLFLEDNDRRIRRRLDLLFTFTRVPDLSDLHFWTPGGSEFEESFPRGTDGCAVLDKWLTDNPECKLVIIDTFAHFRSHETGRSTNVYQLDYEAVMPLTRLAAKHQITLIVVHHERKGSDKNATDFIEDTSGSTGLTGGVDGIMAIKGKRGPSDENEVRQLALTGRDVPHDFLLNIAFDAELGGWRLAKAQDVAEEILALLRKYPVLKLTEIYSTLPNAGQARIRQVLLDLRHEGKVENTANGYRLPGV